MSLFSNDNKTAETSAKVGQNLIWMVWSGVVSIANSILLWVLFARLREIEDVGKFAVIMGLYSLFFGICSLGLIPFLVNEISRLISLKKQAEIVEFIQTSASFLLLAGTLCAFLMTVSGFFLSDLWEVRFSVLILSLAMMPTGLINVGEATCIAFGKTRLIAVANTLENTLRTIVPLFLIWYGFEIPIICCSLVLVRIPTLLIYLQTETLKTNFFKVNREVFTKIRRAVPVFSGTIILASLNWQIAIILLGFLSNNIESAKYGVASRFLIPVSILMAGYAGVVQPILSQLAQDSLSKLPAYLIKILKYPLLVSTLAALLSPHLSRWFLLLFFGENYMDVAPTLDILAVSIIPFCLLMIVARGLIATDSQQVDFLANAVGVGVSFLSGVLLIPQYGAFGAALTQLISFSVMALLEVFFLSKKIVGFRVWQKADFI